MSHAVGARDGRVKHLRLSGVERYPDRWLVLGYGPVFAVNPASELALVNDVVTHVIWLNKNGEETCVSRAHAFLCGGNTVGRYVCPMELFDRKPN